MFDTKKEIREREIVQARLDTSHCHQATIKEEKNAFCVNVVILFASDAKPNCGTLSLTKLDWATCKQLCNLVLTEHGLSHNTIYSWFLVSAGLL